MSSTPSNHPAAAARRLLLLTLLLAVVGGVMLPQFMEVVRNRSWSPTSMVMLPSVFASSTPADYWHTSGNQIRDARDRPVRICGLNWSGFETTNAVVGGLEVQDYRVILQGIAANGYNTVRIPFSNEMVESPSVPGHIAFTNAHGSINSDLRGLDSMEVLDHIVAAAGKAGLKVILDNHRSEAGSSAEENGLWYTARYPESAWIADWTTLARRYRGDATVIGVDLRNEPHNASTGGACWNCGGASDWHLAAQRAGDAVLRVNPRLLIFVEGVDEYRGSATWWGGNLAGVRDSPVQLAIPGRLVYSAHVYGPSEYQQPWFNAQTSPETLKQLWRRQWAFVSESGLAPVWVGEFGTTNDDDDVQSERPGSEGQWFSTLVGFLQIHAQIGWTYWGANAEDRYALLDRSYSGRAANASKALALASITAGPRGHITRAENTLAHDSFVPHLPSLNEQASDRGRTSDIAVPAEAIAIPSAVKTQVAGEESRDSGSQARLQVAQAWRTPAPAALPRTFSSRADKTTSSTSLRDSEGGVDEVIAQQVRQASAEALRRAELVEQDQ